MYVDVCSTCFYCRPELLIHSFFSHFTNEAVIFTPVDVKLIVYYSQSFYFLNASDGKSEKEVARGGGEEVTGE